ncbi:MAG: hypothetical protein AAB552_00840 [Patescibacteria group bacterium]
MKKVLAALIVSAILLPAPAFATTWSWTGKSRVESVLFGLLGTALQCEYVDKSFFKANAYSWFTFKDTSTCPSTYED